MRGTDFEVLLRLIERLSLEQRTRLGRALASASGGSEAVRLLEAAFLAAPRCPHCAGTALQRWGHASGLRRYRCTACRRTFNALTGTSLARLRKKACWLAYGEALAAGMTLVQAAAHCGVHLTTSFRRRHRFLRAPVAAQEALTGVVAADETFFRRSHKGSRRWRHAEAQLERKPRRRGEPAGKRGLSAEQVPALIARPRPRGPHRRCRAARPGRGRHRGGTGPGRGARCRALLRRRQGLRDLRRPAWAAPRAGQRRRRGPGA